MRIRNLHLCSLHHPSIYVNLTIFGANFFGQTTQDVDWNLLTWWIRQTKPLMASAEAIMGDSGAGLEQPGSVWIDGAHASRLLHL